jgi:hypothetical protein
MANYLPIIFRYNLADGITDWLSSIMVEPLQTVCQQLQSHLQVTSG